MSTKDNKNKKETKTNFNDVIFEEQKNAFKETKPEFKQNAKKVSIYDKLDKRDCKQVITEQQINAEKEEGEIETKKAIKSALGIVLGAVVGAILIIFLVLWLCGVQFYYVLTSSMMPTVSPGQVILVNTNIDAEKLEVGDIVTFNKGGLVTTHRIIAIKKNSEGEIYYVQAPDVTYRQKILGETFEGYEDIEAEANVSPKDIVGKAIMINNHPIRLIIIGAIYKLFFQTSALGTIKIIIIVALVVLIAWTIISAIIGKKEKEE